MVLPCHFTLHVIHGSTSNDSRHLTLHCTIFYLHISVKKAEYHCFKLNLTQHCTGVYLHVNHIYNINQIVLDIALQWCIKSMPFPCTGRGVFPISKKIKIQIRPECREKTCWAPSTNPRYQHSTGTFWCDRIIIFQACPISHIQQQQRCSASVKFFHFMF